MNVYKLSVQAQGYFLIEKDGYEQRTARRPPGTKRVMMVNQDTLLFVLHVIIQFKLLVYINCQRM